MKGIKMRKYKFLCILLIIVLLSYCININNFILANDSKIQEQEEENVTKKTQLEKLQESNEELQKQIEESINNLGIVEEELSQNLLQVQELDTKIQESEKNLQKLNEEVEILDNELKTNEEELNKKQQEYDSYKKLLDERLITMYEQGDIQYLDVLLGASNISEFLSNYFMVIEIYEYDMNLLEEVNEAKSVLEIKQEQLARKRETLSEKRKQQQKDTQVLENTKTAREFYISKLSEEEQNLQAQIDEYKAQVEAVETEIRNLVQVASFGEDYIGEQMIWPVPGYTRITSPYGMRVHPITGLYRLHTGTDVGAPIGTNFLAMATGVVVKAEYSPSYGNMVVLDHGGGVQTLYAHGSQILVKLGDQISQGTPVLKVGSTGYSTGPHAHFEIRINGETVNPLDYVKPE